MDVAISWSLTIFGNLFIGSSVKKTAELSSKCHFNLCWTNMSGAFFVSCLLPELRHTDCLSTFTNSVTPILLRAIKWASLKGLKLIFDCIQRISICRLLQTTDASEYYFRDEILRMVFGFTNHQDFRYFSESKSVKKMNHEQCINSIFSLFGNGYHKPLKVEN